MARVDIYTSMFCGYCHRAKKLLQERGIAFNEIDVMADGAKREEMRMRSGGRTTVPQIFIGDQYVGGCIELYELDRAGKLTTLVGTEAS